MAIVDLFTKNYYKLDLAETYIKGNRVYVAYQVYPNEATRNKEKLRNLELEKFFQKLSKEILTLRTDLEHKLGKEENHALKTKYHKEISFLEDLSNDYDYINYYTYVRDQKVKLSEIKQLKFLETLGFKEEWVTDPLLEPSITTEFSGMFTNQKFTADSMYKELKKVFKNSKIMDV